MTNNKLSPGPWRIEDREYFTEILDRDGRKIAEVLLSGRARKGTDDLKTLKARRLANAQAMAEAWNHAQQPAEGKL